MLSYAFTFIAILISEIFLVYWLVRFDQARAEARLKVKQHRLQVVLALIPMLLLSLMVYF